MAPGFRNVCVLGVVLILLTSIAMGQLTYTGVNIATGSFASNYAYPTQREIDYFVSKGVNVFRMTFKWERIQPTLGKAFDEDEFAAFNAAVEYATSLGATVVLDPHNYARYDGDLIGSTSVSYDDFADLWSRLATTYADNSQVIFGLMNEPCNMPTEQWVTAANTAIAAIRDASAENLILVPGNAWTGAHSWGASWYGTSNSVAMLNIVDPLNNFAFDVHQYMDSDNSGTSTDIVSETIGIERLTYITNWLKENGYQAFLGEFAVANATIGDDEDQIGDETIENLLTFMEENSDVWLGWTWWAGGERWNNYMFDIEPRGLGTNTITDRESMLLLESYLAGISTPEPSSMVCLATAFVVMARRRRRSIRRA